jgi:ATP-dependent DNA ligase
LSASRSHRDGWVYEEKVDGWRIVAYKEGARVRLVIAAAISKLSARTVVLDGEVAVYDQQSRFESGY